MPFEETPLPGVRLLHPRLFRDDRGHFLESWSLPRYEAAGLPATFVQDNVSSSARAVVRGLHAQGAPHAQGKLVSVLHGAIYDVVVDARLGSPTYGQWYGAALTAAEGTQLWIPPGFLHGFQALEDASVVHYKCTTSYHQASEFSVAWDDPMLGIDWPLANPILSPKDAAASPLAAVSRALLLPFVPA